MAFGPIQVVPLRPVSCGSLVWTLGGVARATVVVKATFTLVHDGPAQLAAPAELVTSDRLAPPVARGDLAPAQSLAAASDVAPYLPSAGVVVVGSAHAPLGLPTPAMAARLAVYAGDRPLVDKLLHVYGDRSASAPTPRALVTVPIVYERAFGGLGVEDNPAGVGASVSGALPNVVDPKDARRPAGFGPLAPTWGHRRRLLGASARPSVERGALEIGADLDFRYFHAAPPDQQTDFLAGDEWILLDGLDPERPRLRSRLPSARGVARCQVVGGRSAELRALDLSADTLVIDAERRVCHVVWRGHVPIDSVEGASRLRVFAGVEMPGLAVPWPDAAPPPRPAAERPASPTAAAPVPRSPVTTQMKQVDEDALPRISDLDDSTETTGRVLVRQVAPTLPFMTSVPREAPSAPGSAPQAYGLPFRSAGAAPEAAPSPAASAPIEEQRPAASYDFDEDAHTTALSLDELREKLGQVERAPFKLAQPGSNAAPRAEIPGAPWSKQPVAKPPAIDDDMTVGVRVPPPELITRLLAEREAAAQRRAAPAPAESPWARGAPPPDHDSSAGVGRDPGLVAPPPMLGPITPVTGAPTAVAAASSASRPPASAPAASPPDVVIAKPRSAAAASDAAAAHEPASTASAPAAAVPAAIVPEGPVDPARARVLERLAKKEPLDGIEAEGGDLTSLDLSGQSLTRARLRGAKLGGAKLQRAVLTGADLGGADLTGADLEDADLEGADLERATIVEAKLDRAKLGGVNLGHARARRASFDGARGDKLKLAGADLEGASLRRVELTNLDLRSAKLGSARFESAQMPDALLGDASGEHVVFDGARLTKAQAPGAMLAGASFKHADLSGSLWERAKLPRACFEGANLRGANLQRAALANANFEGADLSKADLQRMNAERADFRTASLDGADLRKVQAPDACFADVGMHRANAEKANLAGASFAGADLRGSTFRAATLSRVNASFAKLDGADLREADLTQAVLRGATREGAKLNGADMTGVDEGLPGDPEPAPKP